MKINRNLIRLTTLSLALLLLLVAPVLSAQKRAGDGSHIYTAEKGEYVGAIEKTGFFTGIEKDRVTILDEKTYKKLSYIVAKEMIMTYQGEELEQETLLPHSIVKLIIVDAEVVEIILIQESS